MRKARRLTVTAGAVAISLAAWIFPSAAADVVLSGAIKSATGEPMGGVTVSAKAEGQTITTTVVRMHRTVGARLTFLGLCRYS